MGALRVATLPSAVPASGRSPDFPPDDDVRLTLPADDPLPVARLVVAGAAARAGLDIRQISDLSVALELVLRQPSAGRSFELTVRYGPMLETWVGPFQPSSAFVEAAAPAMRALTDDLVVYHAPEGEWIALLKAPPAMPDPG